MPWRRRRVTQVDHIPSSTQAAALARLLLLLLLVGTGIGLAYFLTRDDDESSSTDRVPAVVGLREAEAVERLRADGYPADIRRAVNPAQVGKVIRQIPSAGAGLEPGKTVVIIVARRPNTVDVPRVVGLDVAEAFERVQAAGLRARSSGGVRETGEGPRHPPAPDCRGGGTSRRNGRSLGLEGPAARGRPSSSRPDGSCRNCSAAESWASSQHRPRPVGERCWHRHRPAPARWRQGPEGIDGAAQRRDRTAGRRLD